MANWRDERTDRQQRIADATAERRRQDAITAAKVDAVTRRTDLETQQLATEQEDKRRRELRKERERERAAARVRRSARWASVRTWAGSHMAHLMIYPLAVFSAWMAIPAMAHFGYKVYGSATGTVLPVITELGMWAFAFAVQVTRHRHPERPVWALQVGVVIFTGVGGGLNFLDGATGEDGALWRGAVMAVVSIAGVVAHQLVEASPRRSRAERDARKVARHVADRVAAVRKAMIEASAIHVDESGEPTLRFRPGHYLLTEGGSLDAIEPDQPVSDMPLSTVDRALVDMVERFNRDASIPGSIATPPAGSTATSTLAPIVTPPIESASASDQQKSTAGSAPGSTVGSTSDRTRRRGRDRAKDRGRGRPSIGAAPARSIEELRAALKAAIEAGELPPDPSGEAIRTTLRCSPKNARELRDNPNG